MSGYRFTCAAASAIVASTDGSGGYGFSFELTLKVASPGIAGAGLPAT